MRWLRTNATPYPMCESFRRALDGRPFRSPGHLQAPAPFFARPRVEALAKADFFAETRRLHVPKGVDGAALQVVLDCAPRLERLSLGPVTGASSLTHPGVRELELRDGQLPDYIEPLLRPNTSLSLGSLASSDTRRLGQLLPAIAALRIRVVEDSAALAKVLARHGRHLRALGLDTGASPNALAELLVGTWPDLEELSISDRTSSFELDLQQSSYAALRTLQLAGLRSVRFSDGLGAIRSLDVREIEFDAGLTDTLREHAGQLTHLGLWDCGSGARFDAAGAIIERGAGLASLTLQGVRLDARGSAAVQQCRQLRQLQLARSSVDAHAFAEALGALDDLSELRLPSCENGVGAPARLPSRLRVLDVDDTYPAPGNLARFLDLAAGPLEALSVKRCSVEGLANLASLFPELRELDITHAPGVTVELLRGLEQTLAVLVADEVSDAEELEAPFTDWVAGRDWPHIEQLHARDVLRFDALSDWLERGRAPGLRELHCFVDEPDALYRYIDSPTSHKVGTLRCGGGIERRRVAPGTQPGWPPVMVL